MQYLDSVIPLRSIPLTDWRTLLLLGVALAVFVVVALLDPIPQDPAYFCFADGRSIAGISNFMNVLSNLPFLFVGMLGLRAVLVNSETVTPATKLAWLIFFFGIALTAFGSGYFHLRPDNDSLIWDRLPMTIGFMSLVSIIISEYFSPALGKKSLFPLLLVGIGSVTYWAYTESLGAGDLRAYAVVQFLPMLGIPLIIALYKSRSDLGRYVWWMIGFYLAAKVAEYYDPQIYALGEVLSGHSIKHLVAALAPASLLYALQQRHHSS